MATLMLSAAGAALGGGIGGSILGLSGAVIGRAVGATVGRMIDNRLLGAGSTAVEMGRIDRFRLMGAGEGQSIPEVWGRMRLGGHVIWASHFTESRETSRHGKGGRQAVMQYGYSVSLAIGICGGEVLRLGRIWADGQEIAPEDLHLRFYSGSEDQMPDPKIVAVEGADGAPAYRGLAYVVVEDLDLTPFGGRVPQFSFEVLRPAKGDRGYADAVRAVALIPGTGEYSLATEPVHYDFGGGEKRVANAHGAGSQADFPAALDQLVGELPKCGAVSVVVSWFGSDLRCGSCEVRPKVEQREFDAEEQVWQAGGIGRPQAQVVPMLEGRPLYGGTPSDESLRQAIRALQAAGQGVMFYPFVLMEQMEGNGLPNPWGEGEQPALPWRGRITLSQAPGREGAPDRTEVAEAEVAAFFGAALPEHFTPHAAGAHYTGPAEDWGYRRFILHYAHICAALGGVEAFCIGSELRGLTQIRGAGDSFPAVAQLRRLLAEVRAIVGPQVKLSYAADWSEYWGYQSPEGGRYFHLDPLWADPEVDFVGIDNYMPLSDWGEGEAHADVGWGSIYDLGYLQANIAGGEGFEWYYPTEEARKAQRREPIRDGAFGEDWIWRYKDLKSWWSLPHHERVGGARSENPTAWVPQSKPFWFTELGCAAIDRATNQPNVFWDPKSSESYLPYGSTGRRDDLIQLQYLRAMAEYWGGETGNPVSEVYDGRMVDMDHAYVWAWDARPFPQFPARTDLWSDGGNQARGHWISGRTGHQLLAEVVRDLCHEAGLTAVDCSALHGIVRGFQRPEGGSARAALQVLMLAYGVEFAERGGVLYAASGGKGKVLSVGEALARHPEALADIEITRQGDVETAGRLRIGCIEAEGDFAPLTEEAGFPETAARVVQTDLPVVLSRAEARGAVERWVAQARVSREGVRLALPPSRADVGVGDILDLADAGRFRIDRLEAAGLRMIEGLRVEAGGYEPSDHAFEAARVKALGAAAPVDPIFLDLPLLRGDEVPHAPHIAISAQSWNGDVAVWQAASDEGYGTPQLIGRPASVGVSVTPLAKAASGRWDLGGQVRVRMVRGDLSSMSKAQVLAGGNLVALGDGERWEVLQFATAELVAPREWVLSDLLRAQAGTEVDCPEVWPVGSQLVVLEGGLEQLHYPLALRGQVRHLRVGAAARGYGDWAVRHRALAFQGRGLRPLSVVHLRHDPVAQAFRWIRRTRIGGDDWGQEVPLGEVREAYRVEIWQGARLCRSVEVSLPHWSYGADLRGEDGVVGPYLCRVAQLSDIWGAGPWVEVAVAN